MENNAFLKKYLQMRDQLANNEQKKQDSKKTVDIIEPETFYSLQSIIDEKPDKQVVKEYLQKRKQDLDEEYGN
jgi:hypothetical protein